MTLAPTSQGNATQSFTAEAGGTIAIGCGVKFKAATTNTVELSGAGDDGCGVASATPVAGATATTAYASGDAVSVQRGQVLVRSGAAFAAGAELTTDAAGKFITRTAATEGEWGQAAQVAGGADEYVLAYINPSAALNN